MSKPSRISRRLDIFGGILAALTLLVIVVYSHLYLSQPDLGFRIHPGSWEVVFVDPECQEPDSCLQVGDRVQQIGTRYFKTAIHQRSQPIMWTRWLEQGGGTVTVVAQRDTDTVRIEARPTEDSRGTVREVFTILFPILFWLTGTLAVLFLRPRDERWFTFVGFQYSTALWISAGFLSATRLAYSSVLFHAVIWFFLPLSIHLHLVLPDNLLKRAKVWILAPLYLAALALTVLDAMYLVDRTWFLITTFAGMVMSLLLLLLRNLRHASRDIRIANRVMLYGTLLGLGPVALLIFFYMIDPSGLLASQGTSTAAGLFLLVSPLWPMTYMYAVYRHDLATFEFRANRLLGIYGFLALNLTAFLIFYQSLVGFWQLFTEDLMVFSLFASSVFVVLAPHLYPKFQGMVDRHIFGIKYRPTEVVSAFAQKIPTALDRNILRDILVQEVLPTLMIRQSALFTFGYNQVEALYRQNVDTELDDEDALRELLLSSHQYISFGSDMSAPLAWVRLIIPLSVRDRTLGIWLLGRRDPDDFYPKSDILLLGNLANQVAPVIENFRLVEKAQAEVQENRRLQQQLLQSQKMEAIGRLSAGVAHDFNNILSVILGYSNLLLVQYPSDDRLQQSVSSIRDAGNRAATLTRQLLAFSRQQVMEPQLVDLDSVVTDVEKMLRRLTGEDIELVTELDVPHDRVRVDPGQMAQVIINLVVNARDAMPDGGRIAIHTHCLHVKDTEESPFKGLPSGQHVVLSVSDDGTGVDPEILGRIFEPYFTTKEVGKGTGLGLSMVYGIINQSQGHVFVESELGEGSTFTVCLPALDHRETASTDTKQLERSARPGTETILLAEDEDSVRAVTTRILESSGYRVTTAVNGVDALEKFEASEEGFDLLLTDVVMPLMKGTELVQRLRTRDPQLRVIFMSGYNEEAVLGQFGGAGPLLLQKPFSPQVLTRRIRQVLDRENGPSPATSTSSTVPEASPPSSEDIPQELPKALEDV